MHDLGKGAPVSRVHVGRNREFFSETGGITETERTTIRDHRDTTDEEPAPSLPSSSRPHDHTAALVAWHPPWRLRQGAYLPYLYPYYLAKLNHHKGGSHPVPFVT